MITMNLNIPTAKCTLHANQCRYVIDAPRNSRFLYIDRASVERDTWRAEVRKIRLKAEAGMNHYWIQIDLDGNQNSELRIADEVLDIIRERYTVFGAYHRHNPCRPAQTQPSNRRPLAEATQIHPAEEDTSERLTVDSTGSTNLKQSTTQGETGAQVPSTIEEPPAAPGQPIPRELAVQVRLPPPKQPCFIFRIIKWVLAKVLGKRR
jgi:hypothetical protein